MGTLMRDPFHLQLQGLIADDLGRRVMLLEEHPPRLLGLWGGAGGRH